MEHRKIILLINFIFARTLVLIASNQVFKYYAILIKQGLFFQEQDSLQFDRFQFSKMNKLLVNSAVFL